MPIKNITNRSGITTAKMKIDEDDLFLLDGKRLLRVGNNRLAYVGFWERVNGKRSFIYIHRLVMNAPSGKDVDHINHDTLDNRKENLKVCTRSENLQNSRKHRDAKWSKVLGVTKGKREWVYQKMVNGVKFRKGFKDRDKAEAYANS